MGSRGCRGLGLRLMNYVLQKSPNLLHLFRRILQRCFCCEALLIFLWVSRWWLNIHVLWYDKTLGHHPFVKTDGWALKMTAYDDTTQLRGAAKAVTVKFLKSWFGWTIHFNYAHCDPYVPRRLNGASFKLLRHPRVCACTYSCLTTVMWLTLKGSGGGSICEKITVIQARLLQSLLLFCSVSHFSWTTAGGPTG